MNQFIMWCFTTVLCITSCSANQVTAMIYTADGTQNSLGKVTFRDTAYGLLIIPQLTALPPGLHGFHVHQHANCNDHGMAAGGHYDPKQTNSHQGPYGEGHLGDLPILYVDAQGLANTQTLAPRLKTSDLKNMTAMVHAGGDNYSDKPPLGGGGARIACGVIEVEPRNTTF